MGLLDKPKHQLNPLLWDVNNKLLPHVKKELLDKLNTLIPKKLIKSVWFIGSSASLQYNRFSDIDINVVSRIPGDREHHEEFKEWHQHFKYHNKQMDFLTGTTHPINYFIQPEMTPKWGDELTSIYLVKDFDTLLEDVWEKPFIAYEDIRDPDDRYELNAPYAKLYEKVVLNKLKILASDLHDITSLEGKQLLSKLKEIEADIYELVRTYKEVDKDRKLQYSSGWGVPKTSDKNFLYKYLERKNLLGLLEGFKETFKD
jgi:predicted nucleotidyltransferase